MKRAFSTAILVILSAVSWAEGIEKGLKLESENRLSEARGYYEERIAKNPADSQAALRLLHVLTSMDSLGEAEKLAEKIRASTAGKESPELFNEIGRLRFRQGKIKEAVAAFRAASSADPSFPEASYNLGVVLQQSGKYGEAEASYNRALAAAPKFVKAMVALGLLESERGSSEKALGILRDAERVSSSDFEVLSSLGMILGRMEKLEESADYYRRAASERRESAEARNNYGRALIRMGKMPEAEREIGEAVRINPSLPEAHLNLGTIYQAAGKLDEAEKEFEKAFELAPRMAEAAFNLGNISLLKAGRAREERDSAAEAREIKAARDYFRAAVKADDKYMEAMHNLSLTLIKSGEYHEALHWAEELAKADPGNASYRFLLGTAELQVGDYKKAEKAYRAALKMNADCQECRLRLGSIFMQSGRLPEAVEMLSAAVKFKEKDAEARYLLGLSYFRQGELRKAEQELMAALELRPDNLDAINNLANVSMRLRNVRNAAAYVGRAVDADPSYMPIFRTAEVLYAQAAEVEISGSPKANQILMNYVLGLKSLGRNNTEAEKSFNKVLSIEPRCAAAHLKLGTIKVIDGDFAEGAKHLEKAEKLSPGDPEVRYSLGTAYYNLGEKDPKGRKSPYFVKSLEAYRGAVEVNPGNPDARWGMASALYRMERFKEARIELENCVKLNPFFGEAYNTLGSVIAREAQAETEPQRRMELFDDARKAYEHALRANPNSETARYNLGVVLHEQKKYKEAIEQYEAALRLNPRFSVAWYRLGRLYAERNNWFDKGRAEKAYLKLMEIEGQNCEYLHDFGVFYFNSSQHEKAREMWQKTLKTCPGHKGAMRGLEALQEAGY